MCSCYIYISYTTGCLKLHRPFDFNRQLSHFFYPTAERIVSHDKFLFRLSPPYFNLLDPTPKKNKQKVSRKSTSTFEKFWVPNFGFIKVNQSVTGANYFMTYFFPLRKRDRLRCIIYIERRSELRGKKKI